VLFLRTYLFIPNTFGSPNWNSEQIKEFQQLLKTENKHEVPLEEAEIILSQMYQCVKALIFEE
jgi:hypothetical protein